jgi:hypothetical protein
MGRIIWIREEMFEFAITSCAKQINFEDLMKMKGIILEETNDLDFKIKY